MIFPLLDPIAFSIGPLDIRWYSLSYIFGILISWFVINKFLIKFKNNIDKQTIDNLITFVIFGIILGGRIGYILFYNFDFYMTNPLEIIKVWKGGMSFHGGLIGIIISVLIFSKIRVINFFDLTDLISLVSPIGILFGRIANFINGELYGRITSSYLGIIFPDGGPVPRHPSQLYEAFFEGIILYLILNLGFFYTKLKNIRGSITALFLLLYGSFRFFIEFFREPDFQIGLIYNFITMGQILCVPMILLGICMLLSFAKKYQNYEKQNFTNHKK